MHFWLENNIDLTWEKNLKLSLSNGLVCIINLSTKMIICCHFLTSWFFFYQCSSAFNYKKIILERFLNLVVANFVRLRVRVMVFNTTFNNISVISWRSVILGGENRSTWRKPLTCRKSLTNFITLCSYVVLNMLLCD